MDKNTQQMYIEINYPVSEINGEKDFSSCILPELLRPLGKVDHTSLGFQSTLGEFFCWVDSFCNLGT